MTCEPVDEFIMNLRVHNDSICTHADLALVQKSAEDRSGHSLIEIRIVQDHEGCVSTQFEGHALDHLPISGQFVYMFADRSGARKGDQGGNWMIRKGVA